MHDSISLMSLNFLVIWLEQTKIFKFGIAYIGLSQVPCYYLIQCEHNANMQISKLDGTCLLCINNLHRYDRFREICMPDNVT